MGCEELSVSTLRHSSFCHFLSSPVRYGERLCGLSLASPRDREAVIIGDLDRKEVPERREEFSFRDKKRLAEQTERPQESRFGHVRKRSGEQHHCKFNA